jgi:hypothetical protein
MASGDSVVQVLEAMPPAASAATIDTRAGGSTPAETVQVIDFDAAADEFRDYKCKLEGYGGGGLTMTLVWSASTATANDCVWQVAIRRMEDDAEDIDAAHTYLFNTVTATAPSLSGEVSYDNITFTDGADMDSWAEGEVAIVRVGRDADNGSDNMAGDAELWGWFGLET